MPPQLVSDRAPGLDDAILAELRKARWRGLSPFELWLMLRLRRREVSEIGEITMMARLHDLAERGLVEKRDRRGRWHFVERARPELRLVGGE